MKRRNAIIMAAGTSSRFVPLSAECPKGLLEVKDEVLIERQIRQLKEAGISDITIIVGYKADMFAYLNGKFGVDIVLNEDFARYNNTSSLIRVIDRLDNTFVCSSDNYFPENLFIADSPDSYYSALYAEGKTNEYCLTTNGEDFITDVRVGGRDAWYMVGHVFFLTSSSCHPRNTNHLIFLGKNAKNQVFSRIGGRVCYFTRLFARHPMQQE